MVSNIIVTDCCGQVVGALAIMMDMKKGVVNETVKENRADELSAMFNMMSDNRKRIMGNDSVSGFGFVFHTAMN